MNDIKIKQSDNFPAVEFTYSQNHFKLSGESFMEDVNSFYGELIEGFTKHCEGLKDQEITFIFDLEYFNSSSSRVIFKFFELLDLTASKGNIVKIDWLFDDEDIAEEGESLAEDFENIQFQLIEKE